MTRRPLSLFTSRVAVAGLLGALTLVALESPAGARVATAQADDSRTPVLVELFTSEGCSSCPPADDVLARLVADQPVKGVEIIALGFHVDYWDELGWVDRFSSPAFTARQNVYAAAWRQNRVYTPQMVVDGAKEFVGSDVSAARKTVAAAASAPKVQVQLRVGGASPQDRRVELTVDIPATSAVSSKADVFVAVTEDGLVSNVLSGENARRRLAHAAVVRSFESLGSFALPKGWTATRAIAIDRGWHRGSLKAVVVVQDAATRRVLGAAVHPLS